MVLGLNPILLLFNRDETFFNLFVYLGRISLGLSAFKNPCLNSYSAPKSHPYFTHPKTARFHLYPIKFMIMTAKRISSGHSSLPKAAIHP